MRCTIFTSFAALLIAVLAGSGGTTPAPETATLAKYCGGCHSETAKAGNFVLHAADAANPVSNAEAWEKVVRKLRARSMPPPGLPRPDDVTYRALLSGLETKLDSAAQLHPNPGRTDTFRRLNRTEYQNAIRDLLHLDVDVTTLLPTDESSHGFDNITVGDLSPTLLERYLGAARKISRLAVGSPLRNPGGETFNLPPDLTQEEHFDQLPQGTRGGTVIRYTFPLNAEYEFQLRLARDRNEHVEGLKTEDELEVTVDGKRIKLFTVAPPAKGTDHHLVDDHLKVRTAVTAGPHTVGVAFLKKSTYLLETERQPYLAHFNMDRHPRITPALYSVSVNGPYNATGPGESPSRQRIFVCTTATPKKEDACAKQIFSTLTRRAFRRSVTDADIATPLKFFREARREGTFDSGIELGLSAILVSPEFLFRVEQDPANLPSGTAYRVNPVELASRLSFFLWSSIPDDELLRAATSGELSKDTVLNAQVRRMLADKRSSSLVTNFADQWLHLRNLASTTPDMRLFPDFDDNLRQAFRRETELFFESILREDRSVMNLLDADYTFVNERLAKHYGIPNIYGSRFRRVSVQDNGGRGGLLRQGSILTVTSYATRTSPVIRGKWILDNILGAPPQPPPPFVPSLKENHSGLKALPMRERIAQHRANPACAGCHNVMDPLGFSLENYDAVGRWRKAEENLPVDASGATPDGTKFDGVAGLQQALLRDPDIFAGTITEKLLTYSLGRGTESFDAPAVRTIVTSARDDNYRFSSVILGIVHSTPFQMRRSQ